MTDDPTHVPVSRSVTGALAPPARARRGWVAAAIAFATCPCHLPLILIALSGTAVGGSLAANRGLVFSVLVVVFLVSAATAWRLLTGPSRGLRDDRSDTPPTTTTTSIGSDS